MCLNITAGFLRSCLLKNTINESRIDVNKKRHKKANRIKYRQTLKIKTLQTSKENEPKASKSLKVQTHLSFILFAVWVHLSILLKIERENWKRISFSSLLNVRRHILYVGLSCDNIFFCISNDKFDKI